VPAPAGKKNSLPTPSTGTFNRNRAQANLDEWVALKSTVEIDLAQIVGHCTTYRDSVKTAAVDATSRIFPFFSAKISNKFDLAVM
jgi:hypothetical protein